MRFFRNNLSPNMSLWVVEDDEGTRFVYEQILGLRYAITFFESFSSVRKALNQSLAPSLALVDLHLPNESFLQFASSSEFEHFRKIPFIVVSSFDDLDILRGCFQLGSVDYLTKPFAKAELIIKLERFMTPAPQVDTTPFPIHLDDVSMTLSSNGQTCHLTSKEFQILSSFRQKYPEPVSRHYIIQSIWKNLSVDPKTFDVHLTTLRRKLRPLGFDVRPSRRSEYRLFAL